MNRPTSPRRPLCLGLIALAAFLAPAPAGAAIVSAPAWAPVAVSGPTHLPPGGSETQRVAVDAEAGTFTLTLHHLAASGRGQFGVNSNGEIVLIGVSTIAGAFAVGQAIEGEQIAPGTTIAAVKPGILELSPKPSGGGGELGTILLTATDTTAQTTSPLPFDASAAEVQGALDALPLVGGVGGSVTVGGGPGGAGANQPYTVAFGGALADRDVVQMSADGSSLTGGAHSVAVGTSAQGGPGYGYLVLYVQNVGGAPSAGPITAEDELPPGLTVAGQAAGNGWSCPALDPGSVLCTTTQTVSPGLTAPPIDIPVNIAPGAPGAGLNFPTVAGGGAAHPASFEQPIEVSAVPAKPGIQVFTAAAYDADGAVNTQAGSHPYIAASAIFVNTVAGPNKIVPAGDPKTISVAVPPGFLGNPTATPRCPEGTADGQCPLDTQVGVASPILDFGQGGGDSAIHNVESPVGYPAKVTFEVLNIFQVSAIASLRSDEDFGITIGSPNTAQVKPVYGVFFTLWGAPGDPSHDGDRCVSVSAHTGCGPSDAGNTAFITQAVDCALQAEQPPVATLSLDTWLTVGEFDTTPVPVPPISGCDQLEFDADFKFEPSDTRSDSPASFRTELAVPDDGLTDPSRLTTPVIRESVVKLPDGIGLNPSGADGLQACTEAQIGLRNEIDPATGLPIPLAMPNPLRFDKSPNRCPEASKIGSGELKSALLDETLNGSLYLAAQGKGNPFGSLFAVYLVIENPRNGIFIKLPGEVEPNKRTGQFQVTFRDLPQLPFTYLRLSLKGGNRSALASPTTCGSFVTTAVNTPWSAPESGPPTESSNGFEINQGPGDLPCAPTKAERPFNLGLKAGTDSASAGAHTPLSFNITRPDGSQELNTLDLGTAPGLVASLKGIPQCGASNAAIEAKTGKQEEANPSCPAASQIGRTLTGAGAGPTPFYSAGKLYLAGPYRGAPLSVVAITPALAGPFDLGNVVVRTALFVNRTSAQVTAKTDPIPQILEGVPLRIKDVRVILDRKGFALNPTNCEASAITVHATGNSGASKDLSARFQVAGCQNLAFKPKLTAKVSGGTKRGDHPAFTAELNYPPGAGYANIKDVQVALPHSEFLDQAHINTICTRVQAAANACPAGSIYGYAEATTPLLDGKLTGPVFLKSSQHQLPDLAIALRGPENQPVEVEFAGRIDSVHAQIRNTIEGLPDVPVSRFVLRMKGGKKGLLVNSRNLCTGKPGRMTVHMVAQNNKRSDTRPLLRNSCGKKGKAKKHRKRSHGSRRFGALAASVW